MSLVGFVILFTLSVLFEGTSIQTIKNISLEVGLQFYMQEQLFLYWSFNDVLFV